MKISIARFAVILCILAFSLLWVSPPTHGQSGADQCPAPIDCPLEKGCNPSSGFGMRTHPITGERKMHWGVDFPTQIGTPILAPVTGVIEEFGNMRGYGNYVYFRHTYMDSAGNIRQGQRTRFAHLRDLNGLERGQTRFPGEPVAYSGNTGVGTGPHLHLEYFDANDQLIDPLPCLRNRQGLPPAIGTFHVYDLDLRNWGRPSVGVAVFVDNIEIGRTRLGETATFQIRARPGSRFILKILIIETAPTGGAFAGTASGSFATVCCGGDRDVHISNGIHVNRRDDVGDFWEVEFVAD
ncbi:MAG TPA: M23 family metallopeptidase [Allosphingosinicella sp.]|nr:M23 family metallopeptidase [Allosphingosinicella sp.]